MKKEMPSKALQDCRIFNLQQDSLTNLADVEVEVVNTNPHGVDETNSTNPDCFSMEAFLQGLQ